MYSLIYSSKAIASFDSLQIYKMLAQARSFNNKNGITGCLLFHNKQFIQLLEGEKAMVKSLFHKITTDGRHENVSLLMEQTADGRIFDQWSMGFYEFISPEERTIFRKHQLQVFFQNSRLFKESNKAGLLFFKSVRDLLQEA